MAGKSFKLTLCIALSIFLLTGCGGVKVSQSVSTIEAGSENIPWESYISVEESEKYNISYDTSQVDMGKTGEYPVIYTIQDKESKKVTTKEFTFKVQDTTAPVITVLAETINIAKDEVFDPLAYVEVTDNCDGTISADKITVESNVDTATEGEYTVTYKAMDNAGNESALTAAVKVNKSVLQLQEKVTIDGVCEFYVESARVTKEVRPPKTGSSYFYSYYAADDGKIYVDVCVAYKNTSANAIDYDDAVDNPKLLYANEYNYSGFTIHEEDNRTNLSYLLSIKPLTTEYVHCLFEVPEEIGTSAEPIRASFDINGETFAINVR